MLDRLLFTKRSLSNGCTLWTQEAEVPITHIRVLIPVGSAHAHAKNEAGVHGIAHFLEHSCFDRSLLFPERDSFENHLAECGGSWNASTQAYYTLFDLQAPASEFTNLLPGFLSHVFNPIFTDEDIKINRDIIRNEQMQQKYYPSDNEMSAYRFNQWMHTQYYPLEQVFGTDIATPTVPILETFHNHYRSSGIHVVAAGNFNVAALTASLEKIATKQEALITEVEPIGWTNREFHIVQSKDIDIPVYSWGGIIASGALENVLSISTIVDFLTDTHIGPLNTWIRKEMGWSYGVTSTFWFDRDRIGWIIDAPLSDEAVVPQLRASLHDHVLAGLNDDKLLARFLEYMLHSRAFQFQTIDDRIDIASDGIMNFGRVISEEEHENWLRTHCNKTFLSDVYGQYLNPSVTGEMMSVPVV